MPAITITIGSDEVCAHAPNGNPRLGIQESLNGRATAQLTIQDVNHAQWAAKLPGAWLFQEITIDHGSERLFGGVVTQQSNSGHKSLSQHGYIDIRAVDFAWYLDARIIFAFWEPGTALVDIVQSCIQYAGPSGDSLSGLGFTYANTSAVPTINARYIADGKTIAEVFNDVAELTGYQWRVDAEKDVHFTLPGSVAGPYSLDEALGATTFEEATTQRTTENYRNTQWVRQSLAALAPLTEVFAGDGSTRAFFTPFALADDAPRVVLRDATYAETTASFSGNPSDGDTVTIDGDVYTFRTTLSAARDVLRGQNATESARNLAYAVNNVSGWSGVYFHASTTVHPTCEAAYNGGQIVTVRVREIGTGDGTAISTSSGSISLGSGTLTGAGTGTVTEQTVGIFGVSAMGTADWYWAPGSTAIYQDDFATAIAAGQYLEVQYRALFSNSIYAQDVAEVTARGRVEAIIDAESNSTGGDLFRKAQALLARFGKSDATLISYTINSYREPLVSQLRVGMSHTCDFTTTHGFNGDLLVTDINRSFFAVTLGAVIRWESRLQVSGIAFPTTDGQRYPRWQEFFLPGGNSGGGGGGSIVSSTGNVTINWSARAILPGTQEVANDVLDNRYRVTLASGRTVALQFATITAKIAPAASSYIADIKVSTDNGGTWNSLFPSGSANKIVLPATNTGAIITPATWPIGTLSDGNLLRVDVVQADATVSGIELVLFGRQ